MGGMTDSRERIDPRYDPRFQRGYVGGEADAPPHAEAPTSTSPVVSPVPVTREPRERVESDPTRPEPEPDPQAIPEPRVAERSEPRAAAAADPADGEVRAADPADDVIGAADRPSDAGPADPESDLRARAWLIAGWLFSGAILAGGLWWAWTAAIDPRYYTGIGNSTSDAFFFLQWTVPPAMVMIGAIGAVVVTTFAGLHQLAASDVGDGADRAASAFPRVPAAYVLVGIAVVGLIVAFWLGGLVADGQQVMWNGAAPQADQLSRVALSRVGEVGIGPIAAAAFASVIGLVLLGVESTRPLRRPRSAD